MWYKNIWKIIITFACFVVSIDSVAVTAETLMISWKVLTMMFTSTVFFFTFIDICWVWHLIHCYLQSYIYRTWNINKNTLGSSKFRPPMGKLSPSGFLNFQNFGVYIISSFWTKKHFETHVSLNFRGFQMLM